MVEDLIARGLRRPELVVLDGSKGLKRAILDRWEYAPIARCQEHKKRNLLGHVSKLQQAWAKRQNNWIIHADSYKDGLQMAEAYARELSGINESAYQSSMKGRKRL